MLTRAAASLALGMALLGGTAGPALPAGAASVPPGLSGQVRLAEQPVIASVGLRSAWRVSTGRGVLVAVLDTGVGSGAADLTGSVVAGPDYTRGADPAGYRPPHLHGTYIASLIAGHGSGPGRRGGVMGVAPAAKVLSVRVLLDDAEPGFGVYNANPRYADAIARGIAYAAAHGADVINMSLGSPQENRDTRAAIADAISHGVVVVAAAGNSASARQRYTPYTYPASYPGVIAVGALNRHGVRASFSDRNSSVVIGAPGTDVVGDAPGGQFLRASGTSPASAIVAGVAALIRAAYPQLPPALVEQALISSTRRRPAGGYRLGVGFGEVDAPAALAAAGRLAAQPAGRGLAPADRAVPGALGPIQVVHRDPARIAAYWAVSAGGAVGFLICLFAVALVLRRGPGAGPEAGPPAALRRPHDTGASRQSA